MLRASIEKMKLILK